MSLTCCITAAGCIDNNADVEFNCKAYEVTCCTVDNSLNNCVLVAFGDNCALNNLTYCTVDNGSCLVVEVALICITNADTALVDGGVV